MAQLPHRIRRIVAVGGMVLAVTALIGAPAVSAKSGDIIRTGNCTKTTDWKLKLSPEDGRIEVEFRDKVTGSARNRTTGETCSAVATF